MKLLRLVMAFFLAGATATGCSDTGYHYGGAGRAADGACAGPTAPPPYTGTPDDGLTDAEKVTIETLLRSRCFDVKSGSVRGGTNLSPKIQADVTLAGCSKPLTVGVIFPASDDSPTVVLIQNDRHYLSAPSRAEVKREGYCKLDE